jgi:regulator of replication initiation timing
MEKIKTENDNFENIKDQKIEEAFQKFRNNIYQRIEQSVLEEYPDDEKAQNEHIEQAKTKKDEEFDNANEIYEKVFLITNNFYFTMPGG